MNSSNRIKECKDMINVLKLNAKGVPTKKNTTVIRSVSVDSFNFVMDEILKILDGDLTKILDVDLTKIEVTEVHTFAKPEDTSGLKFGD